MQAMQTLDALLAFEEQELEARERQAYGRDDKAWLINAARRRQVVLVRAWVALLSAGKAEAPGGVSRGADYFDIHGKWPADGKLEISAAVPGEIAADLRAGKKFYAVGELEANQFALGILGGKSP